ncbi:C40 family peptidase [Microbacterium sp.]|uniref:C40 family peptidase n=1 Tax=Microbacterium sp. TaxID=51671 RepID=UPI0039E38457
MTSAAFAAGPDSGLAASAAAPAQRPAAQTLVVAASSGPVLERGSYSVEVVAPLPVAAAESGSTAAGSAAAAESFAAPAQSYSGENVVAYASEFVGKVPYGTGNDPNDSFSCDGYVQYVFKAFGIELPRGANHQAALGVQIPQSEARAGDLLWWPDTHIAIYDGNGGMLDSPYEGLMVRHRDDLWDSPIFIRLG